MSDNTNGTLLPKYNGYNNKFSWLIALWIDNDQGTQIFINELANTASDKHQLADQIKEFVEEQNPLASDASMYSDLLGSTLAILIDYESIANNYWDERDVDAEDEDDDIDEDAEDE